MLIEWNASLETGIDWLDQDHRIVIDLANQLADALKHKHTEAALNGLIDDFCGYFARHFAEEEGTMEQVKYPGLAEHRAEHADMIETLDRMNVTHERTSDNFDELAYVMLKWLALHLDHQERAFAAFIRGTGAANPPGA